MTAILRHRTWSCLIAACLLCRAIVAFAAPPVTRPAAPPATPRPTVEIPWTGCVTAQCHPSIKSSPVLHGPVASNECGACHEAADVARHTFRTTRQKAELCTYCHEFDVSKMPVVHKPVANGECLGCHDPHGGKTRVIAREASIEAMCGRCHESMRDDRAFLHTPVMKGDCDTCHAPHASRFARLLDATGTDLCLACHTEFDRRLSIARFRHKALEQGCEKCHDAHGTNFAMATTQPAALQCSGCHEDVSRQARGATHRHSVVLTGERACMTCHTAHGGPLDALMADVPGKVCLECHKSEQKTPTGAVVRAMSEMVDPETFKHGPIRDGQCGGCHGAHGTDRPAMLTRAFSPSLYGRFAPGQYDLCFGRCHDPKLVMVDPADKSVTGFRDGTRNLHRVHAGDGDRGRSCTLCHATHATRGAFNVRETFAYGTQTLPMNFHKTATGGSCSPGCHLPYAYDRRRAINSAAATRTATQATTRPLRRPGPAIARAEARPLRVQLTAVGSDRRGHVVVPSPRAVSVLLFLRANEPSQDVRPGDDARSLRLVRLATESHAEPLQVVVICSGPAAETRTRALLSQGDVPDGWQVVGDTDSNLSAAAEVCGWPTVLVVGRDGLQLARFSGTSESLLLRLPPYLAAAPREPATRPALALRVVSDGEDESLQQQLRIARQLLEQGHAQRALDVLTDASRLHPDEIPLRVAMCQALAALERGPELSALLKQLPAEAISRDQRDLLESRAMIATGRWFEAKQILQPLLERDSRSCEAHYLMGRIFEHELDWPRAAAHYRAAQEKRSGN